MDSGSAKIASLFRSFRISTQRGTYMKSNEERLQDLLAYVDSLTRVHPSEIPGIDLYMGSGHDLHGQPPEHFQMAGRR